MKTETDNLYQIHTSPGGKVPLHPGRWLACQLQFAWQRYRQWRDECEAIRHLREIDDYLLEDAGINRWDIPDVVRGRIGYQAKANQLLARPPRVNPCSKLAA